MRRRFIRYVALTAIATLCSTSVQSKTTSVNDITLDVPDGYSVSSSKRGVLVKSPDGEVVSQFEFLFVKFASRLG